MNEKLLAELKLINKNIQKLFSELQKINQALKEPQPRIMFGRQG